MNNKFKSEIYFISLYGSKRYIDLKKYLNNKSLNAKIIRAISIKNKSFKGLKRELCFQMHKEIYPGIIPTDREVACSISHMHAIKTSNINNPLVLLEDDARIIKNTRLFKTILARIEKIDMYDIVLLGFSKSDYKTEKYINLINPFLKTYDLAIEGYEFHLGERYKHTTSGAVGYLISPKAKKKLIEIEKTFRLADDWKILDNLGFKIGYLSPTIIEEDITMISSLDHKQYFIRPLKTNILMVDLILSLRRRILFCYRFILLFLKKLDLFKSFKRL